eukprot:gene27631-33369_t
MLPTKATLVILVPTPSTSRHPYFVTYGAFAEHHQRIEEYQSFRGAVLSEHISKQYQTWGKVVSSADEFKAVVAKALDDDCIGRVIVNAHGGSDGSLPFYDGTTICAVGEGGWIGILIKFFAKNKNCHFIGCFADSIAGRLPRDIYLTTPFAHPVGSSAYQFTMSRRHITTGLFYHVELQKLVRDE